MLVLSRKRHESVVINVNGTIIEVVAIELKNDRVRIGFEAPREVAIHRKEIFLEMQREKERGETRKEK